MPLKVIVMTAKIIQKILDDDISAIFNPSGQPTSKTEATNKYNQDMFFSIKNTTNLYLQRPNDRNSWFFSILPGGKIFIKKYFVIKTKSRY